MRKTQFRSENAKKPLALPLVSFAPRKELVFIAKLLNSRPEDEGLIFLQW